MMMSHPELLHPPGVGDAVVGGEVVAHHAHVEVAPGIHDAPDGRLVRPPHDHHVARPGLGHHLGLEIAAVHRLQVGHDGVVGKLVPQRLDRVQPLRESSGVPASSQSTPAATAVAAVSSASSSEVRSSEI
jgi:hypothetical protein